MNFINELHVINKVRLLAGRQFFVLVLLVLFLLVLFFVFFANIFSEWVGGGGVLQPLRIINRPKKRHTTLNLRPVCSYGRPLSIDTIISIIH